MDVSSPPVEEPINIEVPSLNKEDQSILQQERGPQKESVQQQENVPRNESIPHRKSTELPALIPIGEIESSKQQQEEEETPPHIDLLPEEAPIPAFELTNNIEVLPLLDTTEVDKNAELLEPIETATTSLEIVEVPEAEEITDLKIEEPVIELEDVKPTERDALEDDNHEYPDNSDVVAEIEFQVAESEFVEEVAPTLNTSGDALEAESAVAQIIVPDEVSEAHMEEPQPVIEIDDDILIENDINFITEEPPEDVVEEANTSNEDLNMEYVVINENETEVASMNGMPQLAKEEIHLDEGEPETIVGQESHAITITPDEEHPHEAINEVAEEVTYRSVQVLETSEGLVTIGEESGQEELVILQDENVVVMETEQFDHPESIEINMVEGQDTESSTKENLDDEDDENSKKSVQIPCHVLGRNVENPLEDPVRNGRVLLKPRLGVKIPYRNLTSQIVSKQDITDEIMERSRLRQSSSEPPAGGDVFFAKKLTQRLARKLSSPTKTEAKSSSKTEAKSSSKTEAKSSSKTEAKSSSKTNASTSSTSSSKNVSNGSSGKSSTSSKVSESPQPHTTVAKVQASSKSSTNKPAAPPVDTSAKITDNSDLIALLEGDGDTEWPVVGLKSDSHKSKKRSTDWERETALKQLRELPYNKSLKITKVLKDSPPKPAPKDAPDKPTSVPPPQAVDKESLKSESKESATSDAGKHDELNIEPRFSSSNVVKTYTRKRKPSEDVLKPVLAASIVPSKKAAIATDQKPVSPQKHTSTPSVQKNSSSSPQKFSQKPLNNPSTPKQSSSTAGQKLASKSPNAAPKTPVVVQKSNISVAKSSSLNPSKSPSSAGSKAASIPNLQKISSAISEKLKVSEKSNEKQKEPPVLQKEKTSASEKKKPPESKDKKEPPVLTPMTPGPKSSEAPGFKKTLSPNTYISKSSRIIKRKKIWDPDEATPRFKMSIVKSPKPQEVDAEKSPEKKVKQESNEKSSEKLVIQEKKVLKPAVLKPSNEKSPLKKVMKKIILKKKRPKRLTEVDRLLMDEGAVNLLYSVKNEQDVQNLKKKKKTVISLDRAQRELKNKTNEIKNDLQMQVNSTKESPILLRKKEGTPKSSPVKDVKDVAPTILQRKKSKDSISGSVHSPPASPGFVYAQHADASRIIRRHSSSSFSSESDETDGDENQASAERSTKHKAAASESPKKKPKVSHGRAASGAERQSFNEEIAKSFTRAPDDPKYLKFETFTVRKFDNLVQIILTSTSSSGQTTLSTQVLAELALVLDILQKDSSCRVVLISSSGNSFCQGIDYKELVSDDEEECQTIAENYAVCVRNFLTSLAKFTKILVAGVHGNAIGLGVTMLALFDMVLASDTATFSAPYAQLGCAVEGGVLLTLPHVMHNALASELFFASRKLTAAEALRLGLVTRTLWPDKFQEELISALKIISGQSTQSMQAIKKQLRHHLLQNVESSLKLESSTLIQHWTSVECQNNFSNYCIGIK